MWCSHLWAKFWFSLNCIKYITWNTHIEENLLCVGQWSHKPSQGTPRSLEKPKQAFSSCYLLMLLLPSPPEKKVLKFKYSSRSRTHRLNNPSGMLLAGVDWAHTIESGFYTSFLVSAATLIKHGSLPSFQFSSSLLLQCTLVYSSLFLLSDWETKSYCNTKSDNLSHFDLEAWRLQLKCGIWTLHTGLFTGNFFFFFLIGVWNLVW